MQFLPHVDVRVVLRFRIPEILEYFIKVETAFERKVETAFERKVDIFTISRIRIPRI